MGKFDVLTNKQVIGGLWKIHGSSYDLSGQNSWDGVINGHKVSIERRPLSGLYGWFYGPVPNVGDIIDIRFVHYKFIVTKLYDDKSLELMHDHNPGRLCLDVGCPI